MAHQPCNPLSAMPLATVAKIGRHPRRAVRLARSGMHRAYTGQQRRVGLRMGRWRPIPPDVEARLGDAERESHGGNREAGLVLANQLGSC